MAGYKLIRKKANKERKKTNKKRIINQDIFKVSIFFAVLFFGMIVFLGYFLTFDASSVINNTYNKRADNIKKTIKRGTIYSSEWNVLACTELDEDGNETRVYPYGEDFFHVVGYESNGGMGLESSYNYYLLSTHANIFSKIASEFTSSKLQGDSIHTTLDTGMQTLMNEILGDNEGAIVAIDPTTGEIYGMVSKPSMDANDVEAAWADIVSDEDNSVLLNRVTQATLTPGSTFKIFTLLEYYRENNGYTDGFEYNCEGTLSVDGQTFGCPNGNSHGYENLRSAFAYSCNCAFSYIGKSLDLTQFAENNEKMLFNTDLDLDIATKSSSFSLSEDASDFMIMQTAFGQGETLISPIHLAMVTCAIANNGVLMKPHLVSEVVDSDGNTVKKFNNSIYSTLMTTDEAAFMKDSMRAVVTDGTAVLLSYDGNYYAYGKTGTAETRSNNDENYSHSWFTGFAENDGKKLVVCAMIENTDEAGITGVWAVKQIFDYYFN